MIILNRPIIVEGNKIALGPLIKSDLDRLWRWVNDKEVTQYLHLFPFLMSRETEEKWLQRALESSDKDLIFAILLKPDYIHIGNVGLHRIDLINSHAEIGILIGEKQYWNKGYGTEAMILALDYAFNVIGLHKVYLRVMEFNKRGIRCYEKVGFKIIGRLREHINRCGRYWDLLLMDILREEFNKLHASRIKEIAKDIFK